MNAAEIIILALLALDLLLSFFLHGEPKSGKHNFLSDSIKAVLTIALLHWAGLFYGAL